MTVCIYTGYFFVPAGLVRVGVAFELRPRVMYRQVDMLRVDWQQITLLVGDSRIA
ncbi:hypothetical protein D9M68_923460 [compost metagenome]